MTHSPQRRCGLLGGTFNPVHIGHIWMARDAMDAAGLDEVVFVPCHLPPHKSADALVSAEDRVQMLELAIADEPRFRVSTMELERDGLSYTVDTLRALNAEQPDTQFSFIIGSDSLLELHLWREFEEILERCEILTLARPGFDAGALAQADWQLPEPWPQRLLEQLIDVHRIGVASSDLRTRVAAGLSIRYLVPPVVEDHIRNQGLYAVARDDAEA